MSKNLCVHPRVLPLDLCLLLGNGGDRGIALRTNSCGGHAICPSVDAALAAKQSTKAESIPEESEMSDDKTQTGAQDRSRINLSEDYEVQYWTTKFGTTEAGLRDAVAAVGNSADAVQKYLAETEGSR